MDLTAFRKKYWESHISDYYDDTKWSRRYINLKSDFYLCGAVKMGQWVGGASKIDYMGNFHDVISRHRYPAIAALCARLAEIGVRSTFVVMTSVATLLLEELENRLKEQLEKMATGPFNEHQMSMDLDQWKCQWDLVARFIKQINRCFSIILLLTSASDFIVVATEFQHFTKFNNVNPRAYFRFFHGLLRSFVILAASNRVGSKVFIFGHEEDLYS